MGSAFPIHPLTMSFQLHHQTHQLLLRVLFADVDSGEIDIVIDGVVVVVVVKAVVVVDGGDIIAVERVAVGVVRIEGVSLGREVIMRSAFFSVQIRRIE